MFCSQLSEYFPVNQAQLTNFSCSTLIVLDVSHFNSCILKNTYKKYFLPPARRLVCAVPAVQELQPLLLSGVHPRARHRDQEPAEEVQVDHHPGGGHIINETWPQILISWHQFKTWPQNLISWHQFKTWPQKLIKWHQFKSWPQKLIRWHQKLIRWHQFKLGTKN